MIYKKLLDFKRLEIKIAKDGVNPHFKNRYSTLDEVLSKVAEPLEKLGVLILQVPIKEGLETILYDTEDDTYINSLVPYTGVADMQKLGGAITYARRYALVSMLGLGEDDDDGNTASAKPKGIQDAVGDPLKDSFTI